MTREGNRGYRWSRLDWSSHGRLREGDVCVAYYSYIGAGPWKDPDGRQTGRGMVANLKRSEDEIARSADPDMLRRFKREAIEDFSGNVVRLLSRATVGGAPVADLGKRAVLVPMPPSKAKGSPGSGGRIAQVCSSAARALGASFEELLYMREDMPPFHRGAKISDRDPEALKRAMGAAPGRLPYEVAFVVDDMITSGCHFVAAKDLLLAALGDVAVVGVFYAYDEPRPSRPGG